MSVDKIELEQGVSLTPERIIVSNLELVDEDLSAYLAEFSEEMRVDVVRRALKIGLLGACPSNSFRRA